MPTISSGQPRLTGQPLKSAKKPTEPPLRFGFWGSPFLTQGVRILEATPLAELVFKDVSGFNAPKIALVRTPEERPDVATLELSNTIITATSSMILPRVLRFPVSWMSDIDRSELSHGIAKALQNSTPTGVKLARLANAFGFFFPFASAFWAAPFFRNWLTLKRTHTKGYSYEQMIGLGKSTDPRPQRDSEAEMRYQKGMALKVFGIGSTLGLASMVLFSLAARGAAAKTAGSFGKKLADALEGKWRGKWRSFYEHFELKGKNAFSIAPGIATIAFWGLPAYLGWLHAARSGNEFKERLWQAVVGLFGFSGFTMLTDKWVWKKAFEKQGADKQGNWSADFLKQVEQSKFPHEDFTDTFRKMALSPGMEDIEMHFTGPEAQKHALIRLKNMRYGIGSILAPIAILSVSQLFNFRMTRKREEKKRLEQQQVMNPAGHLPSFGLSQRSAFRVFMEERYGALPAAPYPYPPFGSDSV